MSGLYPTLEDMKVDQMVQVCCFGKLEIILIAMCLFRKLSMENDSQRY